MQGWEAIKALSEGKCVQLDSLYYYKVVKTFGNMNTIMLIDSRNANRHEMPCSITGVELMRDDWEIYEESHDFFWAMEQVRDGKKVKRQCWRVPAYMSLTGFTNDTNYFFKKGQNFLNAEDISAKDWILV